MSLAKDPFNKIKMGKKDIEMRLYDDKRKRIKPKDKIEFTNNETGEMLYVSVVAIHVFDNFEDLYHAFPKNRLGYAYKEKASYEDMYTYYPKGLQDVYRVCGIEIKLIK